MRSVVDGESAPWRFLMRVFVAFALVAARWPSSAWPPS